MYRAPDGKILNVSVEILDDDDAPVIPIPGYPRCYLLDQDKTSLGYFVASPGTAPGAWEASVALPELGVKKSTEYKIKWVSRDGEGNKYRVYDTIVIDPKIDRRVSETVVLPGDMIDFVLPFKYNPVEPATVQLYSNNNEVMSSPLSLNDPDVEVETSMAETQVFVPYPSMPDGSPLEPSLQSKLLLVRGKEFGRTKTFTYRMWVVTPQILLAAQMIEAFVNKSRIENVIPELEYTTGDLIGYLERGLYLFNMTGMTTGFNGLNMQGALLDAWIICASYWTLSSQLLAEGSLAFDFSGQGISLNVDRTPQLDSALGRIESRIQDTVVPLKKQLATQGILSGDGSIGATSMRNSHSIGKLSVINAATTRLTGGISPFIGRRW